MVIDGVLINNLPAARATLRASCCCGTTHHATNYYYRPSEDHHAPPSPATTTARRRTTSTCTFCGTLARQPPPTIVVVLRAREDDATSGLPISPRPACVLPLRQHHPHNGDGCETARRGIVTTTDEEARRAGSSAHAPRLGDKHRFATHVRISLLLLAAVGRPVCPRGGAAEEGAEHGGPARAIRGLVQVPL